MTPKIIEDLHVHCGQYFDAYYEPACVIKILHQNGIKKIWISSTSSCISWSTQEEKAEIINLIDEEIKCAIKAASLYKMNIIPLYWVSMQRHSEGESIDFIMNNSPYKGFKIHPKSGDWSVKNTNADKLFEEVCVYASKYFMPILIHSGIDNVDTPIRFEKFFGKYSDVRFVLAHCKNTQEIIRIFSNYNNVYGDVSFCPKESYKLILEKGYANRMQLGTDFPITYWFENKNENLNNLEYRLNQNYKKTLKKISRLLKQ